MNIKLINNKKKIIFLSIRFSIEKNKEKSWKFLRCLGSSISRNGSGSISKLNESTTLILSILLWSSESIFPYP